MAFPVSPELPLVEETLSPWRDRIGADYLGYRNHVYRMLHFCFALRDCNDEERRKLSLAACFHDIGIWSAGTVDYLPPSIAEAKRHLHAVGLASWQEEIALIIDLHHQFRPYKDPRWPLVEVFRQADLVDFSLGVVRFGLPSDIVRTVKAAFPNAGFHKRLMQLAGGWFAKHPFSPPPFMKW